MVPVRFLGRGGETVEKPWCCANAFDGPAVSSAYVVQQVKFRAAETIGMLSRERESSVEQGHDNDRVLVDALVVVVVVVVV